MWSRRWQQLLIELLTWRRVRRQHGPRPAEEPPPPPPTPPQLSLLQKSVKITEANKWREIVLVGTGMWVCGVIVPEWQSGAGDVRRAGWVPSIDWQRPGGCYGNVRIPSTPWGPSYPLHLHPSQDISTLSFICFAVLIVFRIIARGRKSDRLRRKRYREGEVVTTSVEGETCQSL